MPDTTARLADSTTARPPGCARIMLGKITRVGNGGEQVEQAA
ncbi:hypothetical protein BN6_52540 [Saccharothrix espanaensis DSM 44229]|uniref:Uncharacterized protein n=1 Tax=Saccharothrix espanaensis (strain ATCC 51144 / DSM 44229 / JCM 9112 / NBRC 15066 / NRRL 15764) TaxID=1179773 RepID=K0K7D4_SACES|nr:hypothetical protein BN6_52540 [Saccharothrix espanaensis DSM 44229]